MRYLAAYLLVGFIISLLVYVRGSRKSEKAFDLVLWFTGYDWPLMVFWPAWLAVVVIERTFPANAPQKPAAPISLVGRIGVATTELRPTGRIRVADMMVDARSSGGVLPAGATIRIVQRDLNEWVFEKAGSESTAPLAAVDHPD